MYEAIVYENSLLSTIRQVYFCGFNLFVLVADALYLLTAFNFHFRLKGRKELILPPMRGITIMPYEYAFFILDLDVSFYTVNM